MYKNRIYCIYLPAPTAPPPITSPTPTSKPSKWDAAPIAGPYTTAEPQSMRDTDPKVTITMPADERVRGVIDLMAKFVAADGQSFEQVYSDAYNIHLH